MVTNNTNKLIKVEVAYAGPKQQHIVSVEVAQGSTIAAVIEVSGILKFFPLLDLTQHQVGIFSEVRQYTDLVQEGDRIEIYRPLLIDPKEIRRHKALTK